MSMIEPPEKAFGSNGATPRDPATGQFLKGYSGGSKAGRKKGARARWSEEFMADIEEAWKEQGPTVIARAMFHDPAGTLKALIGILPKHAKLEISTPTDSLSDERLEQLLAYAEARVAEGLTIDADMRNITPLAVPAPFDGAPTLKAAQEREALRADLHAQHDAIESVGAAKHALPAIPYPVGKVVEPIDRDVERRNLAKLDDDSGIDPASLF